MSDHAECGGDQPISQVPWRVGRWRKHTIHCGSEFIRDAVVCPTQKPNRARMNLNIAAFNGIHDANTFIIRTSQASRRFLPREETAT